MELPLQLPGPSDQQFGGIPFTRPGVALRGVPAKGHRGGEYLAAYVALEDLPASFRGDTGLIVYVAVTLSTALLNWLFLIYLGNILLCRGRDLFGDMRKWDTSFMFRFLVEHVKLLLVHDFKHLQQGQAFGEARFHIETRGISLALDLLNSNLWSSLRWYHLLYIRGRH